MISPADDNDCDKGFRDVISHIVCQNTTYLPQSPSSTQRASVRTMPLIFLNCVRVQSFKWVFSNNKKLKSDAIRIVFWNDSCSIVPVTWLLSHFNLWIEHLIFIKYFILWLKLRHTKLIDCLKYVELLSPTFASSFTPASGKINNSFR